LLNSIGFANIFPVSLALYARAAPAALSGTIIGIYYLAFFAANNIVGWIGGFLEKMPATNFWLYTQHSAEQPVSSSSSPAGSSAICLHQAIRKVRPMRSIKYFTVLAFAVAVTAIAQSPLAFPESPQLFETVAQLDAKMFGAFNAHDVDLLMSMFTDDMEFYHDKGGLTNREQTREGFAKMFGNSPDIRRELIPGSLQVYPIKDFGAIEIGTHRFCHKENGKDDCGNFPFVMVWRKSADSWKVSRVISYGH